MPTGFSYEQLKDMDEMLHERIPRSPDSTDAREAWVPKSVATATVPSSGIIVNFGPGPDGKDRLQFLTPVVARQLARGILFAGEQNGWWTKDLDLVASDGRLYSPK